MPGVTFAILPREVIGAVGLAIAGFLALTWLLRGSPFGQPDRTEGEAEETTRGYRNLVVSLAAIGVLLIVAGAWLALAVSVPWSIALFAGGFLILLGVVRRNRRYRHDSPTLHRVVSFADSALNGSLLAGVLIVGNVLAFRYGNRPLDFTHERAFSLASQTVKPLKGLDEPLRFILFSGRSGESKRQLDRILQLLDLYRAQKPQLISYDVLDPYVDTKKFEELIAQTPDVAMADGGGVVVELGKGPSASRLVVRNSDLFALDSTRRSDEQFTSSFHGEDVLTSAVIRLKEKIRPRIGIMVGHGEPPFAERGADQPGLGILQARLEAIGSEVVAVNLEKAVVPRDLAVLLVVGPRDAIEPREAERLEEYLRRGGRAVLMLDASNAAQWDPLLKRFNLRLRRETVVDPAANVLDRPWLPRVYVAGSSLHSIVEPLRNESLIFPQAAPIEILKANQAMRATPLLRTGPESWGEVDMNDGKPEKDRERDLIGPITVAAAVTETAEPHGEPRPRLVLFSSATIAENHWVYRGANLDAITNAIAWLRERDDLQGLAPRTHVALTLKSEPMLRTRLILIPTLIAVSTIVGLGLATYLARRN
jgi:hypothetical protein